MQKARRNVISEKSFEFAIQIVRIVKELQNTQKEYVLSKQLIRSGTSIGAMVREAEHAESKKDFTHKMAIGLKEANETRYWLDLLHKSDYIKLETYSSIHSEAEQIIRLLAAIVKSSRKNL